MSVNKSIVLNPAAFFSEHQNEGSLKSPSLIVAIAGLFTVLAGGITYAFVPGFIGVTTAVVQAAGVIVIFLQWGVYAGIFHFLSSFFDGSGDFRQTLALTGYGFLPKVFSNLVSVISVYFVYSSIQFSSDIQQQAQTLQALNNNALIIISNILSVVFLFWSATLWVFAIKNARNISAKHATIVVSVPVLLNAAWILSQIFLL